MRITRFPSISESQFFGCTAAFVDSLLGELNSAAASLRRLEGLRKGGAFAYEMTLDQHRYGALIVLDRWSTVVRAFGPHLSLSRHPGIITDGPQRIASAENILSRANQLLDAADSYSRETVEVCLLAFKSLETTFAEERAAVDAHVKLGPMLPAEYRESRQIFLEDLAAR